MTGEMPGDVKMMHDGIAGMMAGDPNAMRMPPDKIEQKRKEIEGEIVAEEAQQKEANKPWASEVSSSKIEVPADDGYKV